MAASVLVRWIGLDPDSVFGTVLHELLQVPVIINFTRATAPEDSRRAAYR